MNILKQKKSLILIVLIMCTFVCIIAFAGCSGEKGNDMFVIEGKGDDGSLGSNDETGDAEELPPEEEQGTGSAAYLQLKRLIKDSFGTVSDTAYKSVYKRNVDGDFFRNYTIEGEVDLDWKNYTRSESYQFPIFSTESPASGYVPDDGSNIVIPLNVYNDKNYQLSGSASFQSHTSNMISQSSIGEQKLQQQTIDSRAKYVSYLREMKRYVYEGSFNDGKTTAAKTFLKIDGARTYTDVVERERNKQFSFDTQVEQVLDYLNPSEFETNLLIKTFGNVCVANGFEKSNGNGNGYDITIYSTLCVSGYPYLVSGTASVEGDVMTALKLKGSFVNKYLPLSARETELYDFMYELTIKKGNVNIAKPIATSNEADLKENGNCYLRTTKSTSDIIFFDVNGDEIEKDRMYSLAAGSDFSGTLPSYYANAINEYDYNKQFVAWYFDPEFKELCCTADNLHKSFAIGFNNVKLYAKTEFVSPYIVNFDIDSKLKMDSILLSQSATIDVVQMIIPKKTGFAFLGWYFDAEFTNKLEWGDESAEKNITFYAKWKPLVEVKLHVAEINYCMPAVFINPDMNYLITSLNAEQLAPQREGKKFVGWYYDKDLTNPLIKTDNVNSFKYDMASFDASRTLYAKFE